MTQRGKKGRRVPLPGRGRPRAALQLGLGCWPVGSGKEAGVTPFWKPQGGGCEEEARREPFLEGAGGSIWQRPELGAEGRLHSLGSLACIFSVGRQDGTPEVLGFWTREGPGG